MTFTPAGIKKNAIFASRKSLFSLMWSILSILLSSIMNNKIREIIALGIKIGRMAEISSPARQSEKIIAI